MRAIVLLPVLILAVSCSGPARQAPPEPRDPNVIAVVLGRKITVGEKGRIRELICGTLLDKYARENSIVATDEEVDRFVSSMEKKEKESLAGFERDHAALKKELESATLSEQERKDKQSHLETLESLIKSGREMQKAGEQMRAAKRSIAPMFVRSWKVGKALHATYGGRVIFQQAGLEPVDAYRDFLREQEKKGAFEIFDPESRPVFWRYFTDDSMHTFLKEEEGAKSFEAPWWE